MTVAFLFTPASMTAEQYDRVTRQLEASGGGSPPGRRFHACFGPAHQVMVFDVWDSLDEFQAFGATLMPVLAAEGIELGRVEPLQVHSLVEEGDASALRKTIDGLREQAFFRRPVEILREKLHKTRS